MQTIGTCSNCGGAVQVPMFWGGDVPPTPKCERCGATAREPFGKTIPMNPVPIEPTPGYSIVNLDGKLFRNWHIGF
jgi:hypothetical protein